MFKKFTEHKVTKHTTRGIYWILSILLFIILPSVIFTFLTTQTHLIPNMQSYVVQTGSMQPAIPAGSITYTKKDPAAYQEGDVIAFTNKAGKNVTHRVNKVIQNKNGLFYKTKGDANKSADTDLVNQNSVVGKVIFHVPFIGDIVTFLKTMQGFILVIVMPTILFVIFEIWNIKKEVDKHIQQRIAEGLSK